MRNSRIYIASFICLFFFGAQIGALQAQNSNLIYGTIVTKSGEDFEGFMRWGKEEMYWHDLFNAEKVQSDQLRANKDKDSGGSWSGFDWDLSSLWKNKYSRSSHLFACQFGDIKSLYLKRGDDVSLEMKNGVEILLNGGSNDVGATINLHDYELGTVKIDWRKIDEIHFREAPQNIETPFSDALYGKVKTRRNGLFEGYIKWDLDERCGDDILDGDNDYGDQKIPFKHISSISKDGNGSIVTTHKGRELYLDNSNDVDNGNRGIRVYDPNVGNIEISWKDFKQIDFIDPNKAALGYSEYKAPNGIEALINTYDDERIEGMIVYDIDEMWEIETLDGNDDNIEYQIPFKNIRKIVPKNDSYSMVYLWCGEEYLLGGSQDVSGNNNGILIFTPGNKDARNIRWRDIDEIIFK